MHSPSAPIPVFRIIPRALPLVAALLLVPSPRAQEPAAPDGAWRILRTDGAVLRGDLLDVSVAEGTLLVRAEAGGEPARLAFAEVRELRRAAFPAAAAPAQPWRLELADGARIHVEPLLVNDRHARFANPYTGEAALDRAAVRRIVHLKAAETGYAGPRAGETWVARDGERVLEEDALALVPDQPLGRRVPGLPRWVSVEFTVAAESGQYVSLFETELPPGPALGARGYGLLNDGNSAWRLTRFGPDGVRPLEGKRTAQEAQDADRGPFRMRLLADLDGRKLWLYRNGRRIMAWEDEQPLPEPGDWVAFLASTGPATIWDIRVAPWDGQAPAADGGAGDGAARKDDEVLFRNGDRMAGELLTLESRVARFRSPAATLALPHERFRAITFRDPETPPPAAAGVRVVLRDQSALILALESVADGTVAGRHAVLGAVRIPLEDVTRIVWPDPAPPSAPAENAPAAGR